MDPQLLRHSLKLAVAALLTAAVAMWWERIAFLWYPLLAVVVVVDDNDDQTLRSASGRILGTLTGAWSPLWCTRSSTAGSGCWCRC